MATAARTLERELGIEDTWIEDRTPAVALQALAAPKGKGAPEVTRFHNRENPSPSEMAEMLREVQDTLAALEERLAGLESVQNDSSQVTRRLAVDVVEMGERLARRMKSLENGEAPPPEVAPLPEAAPAPAAAIAPPAETASTAQSSPFMSPAAARVAPARRNAGVIVGVAAAVLALAGVGIWAATRPHTPPPAVAAASAPAAHQYALYPVTGAAGQDTAAAPAPTPAGSGQ